MDSGVDQSATIDQTDLAPPDFGLIIINNKRVALGVELHTHTSPARSAASNNMVRKSGMEQSLRSQRKQVGRKKTARTKNRPRRFPCFSPMRNRDCVAT